MKVLITGSNGQLGTEVVLHLQHIGIDHRGFTKEEMDITSVEQVESKFADYMPDIVIHCAAFTAVDKAETEKELCYDINVTGTKNIAKMCKKYNAKLIYISTDYVFDGNGVRPFEVYDIPNPINYYGYSKYLGELEVKKHLDEFFIIRISWVFGEYGNNFVNTMIRLAETKKEISVVADQVGSPTFTYDLTKVLVEIMKTDKFGVYHITNEGFCSWYEFAIEIFKLTNNDITVNPLPASEYITAAKRPQNSRLSKAALYNSFNIKLDSWNSALRRFILDAHT